MIVGRREYVNLPELSLFNLEAKIDSGAKTSCLHAKNVEEYGQMITFSFDYKGKEVNLTLPFTDKRRIKSSNGQVETRYVIETAFEVGCETRKCQLTLSDRSNMKFPVLVGERLLSQGFLVDTSLSFIA